MVADNDTALGRIVEAISRSQSWKDSAIFVTWDDWGGWYDHVVPPQVDGQGYGFRVPALIISPFAKRGFVDKTSYDTTSILKFITRRFELEPLPGVRQNAGDLTNAFVF